MTDWTYEEIVLACELVYLNTWGGLRAHDQRVVELSRLLRAAPLHPPLAKTDSFRSANSVQRKTFDIATQHPAYSGKPTRGNKLDRVVLDQFRDNPARMVALAAEIRRVIMSGELDGSTIVDEDWEQMAAEEGRLLWAVHLTRERDPRLRAKKIAQVVASGGSMSCEVCTFDFHQVYGPTGLGYIEVHHVLPLHASGPTTTYQRDLALLCSNCHRMIHRASPWLTPANLRDQMIAAARAGSDGH